MPLSTMTAGQLFGEARKDTLLSVNDAVFPNRFKMINSVVDSVYNSLYPSMISSYRRKATLIKTSIGKYDESGTATFTASTSRLTSSVIGFSFPDVGKQGTFRQAGTSNIYPFTVTSVISGTVAVVSGAVMPTSDITLANIELPGTYLNNDVANLTALRINRVVAPINITLESSLTRTVRPLTLDALRNFSSSSYGNLNTIGYCLDGDTLIFRVGDSLPSAGTLLLRYPGMPIPVVTDSNYVDLPDGTPIQLAIAVLRAKIQRRLGMPINGEIEETLNIAKSVFAGESPDIAQAKADDIKALL